MQRLKDDSIKLFLGIKEMATKNCESVKSFYYVLTHFWKFLYEIGFTTYIESIYILSYYSNSKNVVEM